MTNPQKVREVVQGIFDRYPDMTFLHPDLARPIGTKLLHEFDKDGLSFSNWDEITGKTANQIINLILAKLGLINLLEVIMATGDRVKMIISDFMKENEISGPKTNPLSLQDKDRLVSDLLLTPQELSILGQRIFAAFATEFSNPIDFQLDFGLDNPREATIGGVIAYVLNQTKALYSIEFTRSEVTQFIIRLFQENMVIGGMVKKPQAAKIVRIINRELGLGLTAEKIMGSNLIDLLMDQLDDAATSGPGSKSKLNDILRQAGLNPLLPVPKEKVEQVAAQITAAGYKKINPLGLTARQIAQKLKLT